MRAKISSRTIQNLLTQSKPYEVVDIELKGFLLRIQPSGIMTYYFAYRNAEGTKKRYKIGKHGTITPVQARDVALKLSARIIDGEDVQEVKKQDKANAIRIKARTLEGFLTSQYKDWVLNERKTGLATYKRIHANFKSFMTLPLEEINHWSVEKWRSMELKAGKKPATVNRDITALKAVLSKSIEWNVITDHPLAKLKPVKIDKNSVVRYLSPYEEKKLREALIERDKNLKHERDNANKWREQRGYELYIDLYSIFFADYLHPIVLLAINTGLRRGELFQLMWSDVNFDTAILTVRGAVAKSGKTRHIPLNQEALEILFKWRKQQSDNPIVFPSKNGMYFNNINKSWKGLITVAGIKNFRFHDLRHHFASKLVMASVDLNTVRELLGHSDISMTLRYAHLAPEHKANAVAKLVE